MSDISKVLVLNADLIPIQLIPLSVISWNDAIILIYQEKATAIRYQDKYVRSPTITMQVPSVIVMKSYKYFKKYAKLNKYNIKLRDEFICQYCNKTHSHKSLTIDHVLPKSQGGKFTWENLVAACKHCNSRKDNKSIVPKAKPTKPTYYQLAKKLYKHEIVTNEHWNQYINV